ncbi:MAG: PAS domain-containing sensor histidine kinase [bacterium]|nr:PAS domain-containing sensor histidine kinase [bacterium]
MDIKGFLFNNDEKIYNNFPDAIIVLDFTRNIIMWNKKAEIIFGYTKSEVKNKNIMMLFLDDFEKFNKIIGLNHGSILNATTKTGEKIFVDVTAYDAYNSGRVIVSARTLSNKYLELESLLNDYQATKNLVTNRDSFLSKLKPDFEAPLNATIGFSQSLLDGVCEKVKPKQEKYIKIINSNGKRLKTLTEKVFEIIALDANSREFNFKNFDLLKILEFTVDKFKTAAEEKNIKISTSIDTTKRNIYGDEYAFAEIIEILLDNAVKFSKKGEIAIKVFHPDTETLEYNEMKSPMGYTSQSYLQFDIIDNGMGITDEQAAGIFDEYSEKNLAIAQKYDGTALSLPIAKKLVYKLNGKIWYSPNKPKGCIFSLLIPIERMNFE